MTNSPVQAAIIAAACQQIHESGVEALALRALTASVGKSTTAIFQIFGDKAGLLQAVLEQAVAEDRAFHHDIAASLSGASLGMAATTDLITAYVVERARRSHVSIILEALYKSRQFPAAAPLLRSWHDERDAFWRSILPPTHCDVMVPFLLCYLAEEEAFASGLQGSMEYAMLLQETVRQFVERPHALPGVSMRQWIGQKPSPQPTQAQPVSPAMERLLAAGIEHVEREGASGFNAKKVATAAGVSHSQIVYHFGDFAAFRSQAIWGALMQGIPDYLDSKRTAEARPAAQQSWLDALTATVRPGGAASDPGYYVNYARTLGQTCLAARNDRDLMAFILHLRAIEGRGVHKASTTSWPAAFRLTRADATGFAMWIKGYAILNEALDRQDADALAGEDIIAVAAMLAS